MLPDDAIAELGENIYVVNQPGQADKFVKTTEAILNHVQKTYKHGEDIKKALKTEQEFDFGSEEPKKLFYKKLLRDLEKEGFEVNPYDPCVANKIVDGKQLTVTWHVDDLKVSHVKTEVIDDLYKGYEISMKISQR